MSADAPALTAAAARRAARNAGALALARVISSGAQFGWQLVLARQLGEFDLGIYGTVSALFSLGATFTGFSMSLIIIREVARQPQTAPRYLSSALFVQTLLALVAYMGANAAGAALGYAADVRAYIAIACLSLFIDLIGNLAYDQLLAQERMAAASVIEIAHILLRIGLAALLLFSGWALLGVYAAALLLGAARAAALWRLLKITPRFPLDRVLTRTLLIASAPLALAAALNIAYIQLDRLMTTALLTLADTGHLTAALTIIIGMVEVLNTAVLVAVFPLMSRLFGGGAAAAGQRMTWALALLMLILGGGAGVVVTAFAPQLMIPLFGERFAPSAGILRVLIWYGALTMIANVFAQSLMAQDRQGRYVAIRIGGLAVKLALNIALLPLAGVVGAAWASVIAEAVVLVLLAREQRFTRAVPQTHL